jgi:DNA-binding response OmpR family regulator
LKILIVEDEHEVRELLREALESLGGRCVVAGDAGEADRLISEEPVDAVTLDLGLPGNDGVTWLERMAAERPELAQRTLVITGKPLESSLATRLARCGAGILAKPFTMDHLADAVRSQLERGARDPRSLGPSRN